jgi:hypothetical protein
MADLVRAPAQLRAPKVRSYLTVPQAAQLAELGATTIISWCQRGIVKARKVPGQGRGRWRIDRSDFERQLAGRTPAA